jgi:hypothetical protein
LETLEIIIRITLVLHLIGFATIFGGVLAQTKNFKTGAPVSPGILHGSWLALITGLILTGLVYANGEQVNNLALSLKGLGITAIFFIAYTFAKRETAPKWVVPTIGLLTVLNVIFAVVLGIVKA